VLKKGALDVEKCGELIGTLKNMWKMLGTKSTQFRDFAQKRLKTVLFT